MTKWNKVLAVNLSGAFFLAQAALAHMLQRGTGRIVIVSSIIGETGAIGQANYAASKAGLFGLTKTFAREACFQLARSDKLTHNDIGVTVNTVTPGYVATEMVAAIPDKVLNRIKGTIPAGRLARPDEIARVVHFLAADAPAYITGQVWGFPTSSPLAGPTATSPRRRGAAGDAGELVTEARVGVGTPRCTQPTAYRGLSHRLIRPILCTEGPS